MSAYRLTLPYERPPLQRRLSGLGMALAVNLGLLLLLLTLGYVAPDVKQKGTALVVDLLPELAQRPIPERDRAETSSAAPKTADERPSQAADRDPVEADHKRTSALANPAPSHSWPLLEMSKADLDAADVRNLPKVSGGAGDSDVVGKGPHGETLYAAEWARHPTDAELGGYLPHNAPDGFGEIACKTIPGDRVEDCVEIDQTPGSHLASAVRQAAWQFRVRPPRKNGIPLVGSWVQIHIDYETLGRDRRL